MKNVARGPARSLGARVAVGALAVAMLAGCSSAAPDASSTAVQTGVRHAADGGGTNPSGSDAAVDAAPLVVTCTPVAGGVGAVSVNNAPARQYYVDLPTDTSQPMALMFSWHGYKQAASRLQEPARLRPERRLDAHRRRHPHRHGALSAQRARLVHPEGSSGNVDFPYFEGMLSLPREPVQHRQDSRLLLRLLGGGGLHQPPRFAVAAPVRGHRHRIGSMVRAILPRSRPSSPSGSVVPWDWPPLNPADRGNVLMTHGGTERLRDHHQSSRPRPRRPCRSCSRTSARSSIARTPLVTPSIRTSPTQLIYEYLLAHQLGQPSPFQGGKAAGGLPVELRPQPSLSARACLRPGAPSLRGGGSRNDGLCSGVGSGATPAPSPAMAAVAIRSMTARARSKLSGDTRRPSSPSSSTSRVIPSSANKIPGTAACPAASGMSLLRGTPSSTPALREPRFGGHAAGIPDGAPPLPARTPAAPARLRSRGARRCIARLDEADRSPARAPRRHR